MLRFIFKILQLSQITQYQVHLLIDDPITPLKLNMDSRSCVQLINGPIKLQIVLYTHQYDWKHTRDEYDPSDYGNTFHPKQLINNFWLFIFNQFIAYGHLSFEFISRFAQNLGKALLWQLEISIMRLTHAQNKTKDRKNKWDMFKPFPFCIIREESIVLQNLQFVFSGWWFSLV